MAYEFNKEDIENRIKEIEKEKKFEVHFSIPVELEDTYNTLIENDIGHGDNLIIDDVIEEIIDGRIVGYIVIEVADVYDYDTIFSRASQFDMLSKGEDLITECEV